MTIAEEDIVPYDNTMARKRAHWPAVGLPKEGMQIIKNDLELPPECANIFFTM